MHGAKFCKVEYVSHVKLWIDPDMLPENYTVIILLVTHESCGGTSSLAQFNSLNGILTSHNDH